MNSLSEMLGVGIIITSLYLLQLGIKDYPYSMEFLTFLFCLIQMNPCEHPIVILKDVAHQELRQLLQFMYRGEVHVRRQELSGFLHTAELLQVKGLTGGREVSDDVTRLVYRCWQRRLASVPIATCYNTSKLF